LEIGQYQKQQEQLKRKLEEQQRLMDLVSQDILIREDFLQYVFPERLEA